jgi:hypothetical protein
VVLWGFHGTGAVIFFVGAGLIATIGWARKAGRREAGRKSGDGKPAPSALKTRWSRQLLAYRR